MEKRNKNVTQIDESIEKKNKAQAQEGSPYIRKKMLRDAYNKEFIMTPKIYIEMQEELSRKKENNLTIDYLIEEGNKEIKEIYDIIYNKSKKSKFTNLIPLFKKTKIHEFLKSDLLFTGIEIDELINYMNPFMSLNLYNLNEFIYSYNDPGENIYLLLKGEVGLYKLIETEEMFTAEDYYFYLYNQYITYKKLISPNIQGNQINILDINDFIDIDSLISNANRNKSIFPLYALDDIQELNKIIFSIKLYLHFLENKKGKITDLYRQYKIPFEYFNCDKLIKNQISMNTFIEDLSKSIKDREKFYMKYLGKVEKYKVKIHKFIKYKNLKEYSYFGNFEIIDTKPLRKDYAISENNSTILLLINKKDYSKIVNKSQKERRKKEIDFLHNNFFFKYINRPYFESKIFIKYEIDKFFSGHILSHQGEKMNNFIFIEEGIIKFSIDDTSLLEFPQRIRTLYDFIIKKAKEFDIDQKSLIDFDIKLNQKTNLKYELIEETLKRKQNFTISKTEKGLIGEYEYFFNIPSFITSTVISKNNRIFFYDFKNFKKVNDETHAFNENLKKISFYKLKSILKRMISMYNSYFSFSMKIIEDKLEDRDRKLEEKENQKKDKKTNLNNSLESGKKFSSPIYMFRNKKINIENFFSSINESLNSKYNNENSHSKSKKNKNNLFSKKNLTVKTLYNIKHSHHLNDNTIRNRNKMTLSLGKVGNKPFSLFHSINTSFKKQKERLPIKKLKFQNDENTQTDRLKNISNKNDENYNVRLKEEKNFNNKILDVFLPPLSENVKTIKPKIENRNINKYLIRHALHTFNSINNTTLGHTEKNNVDENLLTNVNFKKSKKTNNQDIKNAQILLLKKRDQKAKLIFQKKNELEYFIDEDIF